MSRGDKRRGPRLRWPGPGLVLLSLALLAACDALSSPTIRKPAELVLVTGDRQRALAGTVLPEPVVVKVVDALGRPVGGQPVAFRVVAGGGTVDPATARSDASGLASARWTLGAEAPGEQRLIAGGTSFVTGDTLPAVSFTASAQGPAAASVIEFAGGGQTGQAGSTLSDSLAVRVTDPSGRPLADQAVSWTVIEGDGSVSPTSTRTNASGVARTRWQLGGASGLHRAAAAVGGLPRVLFTATASAASVATVTRIRDNQSATVGATLADSIAIQARTADGRPAPGVEVVWSVTTGGGQILPGGSATDAQGVARAQWRLGLGAGPNSATAQLAGGLATTFTATGAADLSNVLLQTSGNLQTAVAGTILPNPLEVRVADRHGNRLSGRTVRWQTTALGGSITTSSSTDAQGLASATWILGTAPGENRATATVSGLQTDSVVQFVANGALPGTAAITKNFDGQTAPAGANLPRPLSVTVRLDDGRPVVGVRVYWLPTSGNVDPSESVTDAAGVAQTSWRLGGTAGAQTLRAVVIGIQEVTFSATATP